MKKFLVFGLFSVLAIASGTETLPISDGTSSTPNTVVVQGQINGKEVIIARANNSGKYVKKGAGFSTIEEGLKLISKNKKSNVKKVDNLDTNYLLRNRSSMQKGLNSREMDLSDKKLLSGKTEAIKRVSTSFEYYNDSIFEVFSTPDFITIIKFNPDESIIHVAGGDPENWNIEQVRGGEENSTYLYVMPVDTDLVTNLSVITDKRAYVFTLYSTDYTYNPLVRFTYPLDRTTMGYKLNTVSNVVKPTVVNNVVAASTNSAKDEFSGVRVNTLNDLDFNYLVSKSKASFVPRKIYSDLRQTVIEFDHNLVEAPVLFVEGPSGDYEVVNYKHTGNRILVDRKIQKAALKLGDETVYIKHK